MTREANAGLRRNQTINFISWALFFPDCIRKHLVLSLHFTINFFFKQGTIDAGFSERLKLKDDAVLTIFDLMSLHSTHQCRTYAVKHTQLLANHSSGCLLPCLQSSSTPIQTERSDEGVKTGQKIAYFLLTVFLCKNIDNIISWPQRTVHDPFKCLFFLKEKIYIFI